MDGSWEPPQIPNPAYKGEWKPRQIPNPAYKGEWVHPQIDNPEYFHDDSVYKYDVSTPHRDAPFLFARFCMCATKPQLTSLTHTALTSTQDFGVIGFDLWQVKAGTIFDNVLITDSEADQAAGAATFKAISEVRCAGVLFVMVPIFGFWLGILTC
jgi:calreticulin